MKAKETKSHNNHLVIKHETSNKIGIITLTPLANEGRAIKYKPIMIGADFGIGESL